MRAEVDCANAVHGYPLPSGYMAASDEAMWRLEHGWKNPACPECGLFGWKPPATGGSHG